VGLVLKVAVGQAIESGAPLAVLHVNNPERVQEATQLLLSAFEIGDQAPEVGPLIREFVS
jgi:thymidine phosphorylase